MLRTPLGRVLVLCLLTSAALLGCSSDKDPPEVKEGHGVRLSESDISAEFAGSQMTVRFVLQRTTATAVAGTLKVEALRMGEDAAFSAGSTPVDLTAASTPAELTLTAPVVKTQDQLGAWVLRYTLELPGGKLYGRRSLFMAAKRSGLTVVGNDRFAAGEKGLLRILVTNPTTFAGFADEQVRVEFTSSAAGSQSRLLASGKTDATGLFLASFTFTAAETGTGTISVTAGVHKSSHPVRIEQERQVLLTTDKPLYQPGQTVFIRALAMKQPQVVPVADEALLLEVEDAQGNKLFKQTSTTDKYGIVSLRFALARLLALGTYTVRATVGSSVREKTFKVDRYVLPKFKVTVSTTQAYFAPGSEVSGSVEAAYFFGKKVQDGAVVLTAIDGKSGKTLQEIQGRTDSGGSFPFKLLAPLGPSLRLEARVTDVAGAEARGAASVLLSAHNVVLQLLAERKEVVAGDELTLFALLTDPVGKALGGSVSVAGADTKGGKISIAGALTGTLTIPPSGLLVFSATVDSCLQDRQLPISMTFQGQTARVDVLCKRDGALLRLATDRALYREGDEAVLTLRAPADVSAVNLEVIRRNATVHSEVVPLEDGKGSTKLTLGAELRRTLVLKASAVHAGKVLSDQKLAFVAGKDQLNITVSADKASYRPAEQAKLTLQVKDHEGNPAPGVLGVQVVDEALWALTEFKPGLERRFFFLEQDVIDSGKDLQFVDPMVLLSTAPGDAEQIKARMLFAAAGQATTYPINFNSGAGQHQLAIQASYVGIYALRNALEQKLYKTFGQGYGEDVDYTVVKSWLQQQLGGVADDFGQLYKVTFNGSDYYASATIEGAGMDELWNTADDLSVTVSYHAVYPAYDGGTWSADAGAADSSMSSPDAGPSGDGGGAASTVNIREDFPETLYVNPALITDGDGKATIDLALADSITTWRLSTIAHTLAGQLGSTSSSITVFQEFFVDTLLPKYLVQNDEVEVPVPVYNYTAQAQTVTVTVKAEPWFAFLGASSQQLVVPAKSVASAKFRIQAKLVGTFGFTATGVSATDSDGVKRSIEVLPDGEKQSVVVSGVLQPGTSSHVIDIPAAAIDGASELVARIFPGLLSEVVEGFESLLHEPTGCFEQTSSSTYPNVLVLRYLEAAGLDKPALVTQAQGYIGNGYQRLLTYEVQGGGFSLWGKPPANVVLTAFGLMEFADMAKTRYVDPALLSRTQAWLIAQQGADGSFALPESKFYEIPGNAASDTLRATAYIAWGLQQSGYKGPALTSALSYVKSQIVSSMDVYTNALAANALLAASPTDPTGLSLLAKLKQQAVAEKGGYSWTSDGASMTYGYGDSMQVETTALVLGALLLAKDKSVYTAGGVKWLSASKSSYGGYGTTQATILALRALLMALEASGGDKASGTLTVSHNSKAVGFASITPATSDVVRLFDMKSELIEGANTVDLNFSGTGELAYQVVGTYYLPHGSLVGSGPLSFSVAYDQTSVKVGESIEVTATVGNSGSGAIPTVMVQIGLPPGFTVDDAELDALKATGLVNRSELLGPHLVLYLGNVASTQTLVFKMKASLEVKAKAPTSSAYPYYTPEFKQLSETPQVTVTAQ